MAKPEENSGLPFERTSQRPSAPPLSIHGCRNSHTFFFPHRTCPRCGAPTTRTDSPPDAVLVSHTTVRVSPSGAPFRLGLARVASGAQTLCLIEGELGSTPVSEVVIEERGGLYYARPRSTR